LKCLPQHSGGSRSGSSRSSSSGPPEVDERLQAQGPLQQAALRRDAASQNVHWVMDHNRSW
jgi:hypothetical protein